MLELTDSGPVNTNIFRNVSMSHGSNAKSPAQGAATLCYVATNAALANVSGEFFANCNPAPQSAHQQGRAMIAKLWDVSTKLTRAYLS